MGSPQGTSGRTDRTRASWKSMDRYQCGQGRRGNVRNEPWQTREWLRAPTYSGFGRLLGRLGGSSSSQAALLLIFEGSDKLPAVLRRLRANGGVFLRRRARDHLEAGTAKRRQIAGNRTRRPLHSNYG